MIFQSQWFQLYGVAVESYFFCDRHAFGPADGIWGVLSMLFRKGESKGVKLRTAKDYMLYFLKLKKEKPGLLENVEMFPFLKMDANQSYYNGMRTNLSYGLKQKSHFVYTVLDEKGREIHVPGVFRTRSLVGTGPWAVVDLRSGQGRACKLCPGLLQRPVAYRKGDHHVTLISFFPFVTIGCMWCRYVTLFRIQDADNIKRRKPKRTTRLRGDLVGIKSNVLQSLRKSSP